MYKCHTNNIQSMVLPKAHCAFLWAIVSVINFMALIIHNIYSYAFLLSSLPFSLFFSCLTSLLPANLDHHLHTSLSRKTSELLIHDPCFICLYIITSCQFFGVFLNDTLFVFPLQTQYNLTIYSLKTAHQLTITNNYYLTFRKIHQ